VIAAREDAKPQVAWKEGCIKRYKQTLYLLKKDSQVLLQPQSWNSFPQPLVIKTLGTFQVKTVEEGLVLPAKARIEIRFRQGGELFHWHGQTKQLKKLFQEWNIPPWQRANIPLLYINGQLAAIIGHAISDLYYDKTSLTSYQISFEPTTHCHFRHPERSEGFPQYQNSSG